MTILSLFTTVQLSILGRSKYVQAVLQQEREERLKERLARWSWHPLPGIATENEEEEDTGDKAMSDEVEMVYLTLSWWVLHVGWKDVGERVRRGVEEVFEA